VNENMRFRTRHSPWIAAVAALALAACTPGAALRGEALKPPRPAPDFALRNHRGATFRLSAQRGNVVVMFFGYTYCPDICPLTLARLRNAQAALGPDADRVRFVFVTADPARDRPDVLRRYLALFSPTILGLTGSEAEMRPVYTAYGVVHEKVPRDGPNDYLVNHSSHVTVIDRSGRWRLIVQHDHKTEDLVADLRVLLREPLPNGGS